MARPRFSRGHGFGNRLFPWARARVFASASGARFVTPIWTRSALGPWLRGGIARRHYRCQILLSGLFRRRSGDLPSWRGPIAVLGSRRVEEPEDPGAPGSLPPTDGRVVVDFTGWRDFFGPLLGHEAFLRDELRAITRPRWLALANGIPDVPIAINVRCGRDFARVAPVAGRLRAGDATPVEWFVTGLRALRAAAGTPARAYVVSDGTPEALAPLLGEPEVSFVRPGCAISDLLVLARARVLLASGSSSFSAWGAFLGRMPAASHPGQPLTEWRLPSRDGTAVRAEWQPQLPDSEFLSSAVAALRRKPTP